MKSESAWVLVRVGPYCEEPSISHTLELMGSVLIFSSKAQANRHIENFIPKGRQENFKPVEVEIIIKENRDGSQ